MVKKSQDSAIIVGMIGIIIREIAILALSISIFPLAFLFLLLRGDISEYGLKLIYQELISSGTSSVESALLLLSAGFGALPSCPGISRLPVVKDR